MAKRSCDRATGVVLRGTESSLTLRWRELDSNFPYAGAMNLVFAPFGSRSIVRVLPEAHPTMAMRVTRPTRLASYQPEGDGAYPPYSGSPGYGGHHGGDEPPKIGFALTCMGVFLSSGFLVCCRFLVWSGKAVPRPVACDQVRGARGKVSRDRNASVA